MQRVRGGWSSGGLYFHAICINFLTPTLSKLDGVVAKLKPLTKQRVLVKFLRNADNAKVVSGFVQDLADAVGYYQVRVPSPVLIFN